MPSSSRFLSVACCVAALTGAGCASAPRAPSPVAEPAPPVLLSAARQLIVVVTPDWNATTGTLRRYSRDEQGGEWHATGLANQVVVGRTGIAWGDESLASSGQPVKHEGDGRSPAGVFPLDTAFGFAPVADAAWLRVPYVTLNDGSDCVDDGASVYYNTVVDRAAVPRIDWNSAEHMRQISEYRLGVIVGYNAAPPRRGRGSCIFLHIWDGPNSVTAGCTALDASELEALMRWLDPARRPALVQLTAREYARLSATWRLPAR